MTQSPTWDALQLARHARLCGDVRVHEALMREVEMDGVAWARRTSRWNAGDHLGWLSSGWRNWQAPRTGWVQRPEFMRQYTGRWSADPAYMRDALECHYSDSVTMIDEAATFDFSDERVNAALTAAGLPSGPTKP